MKTLESKILVLGTNGQVGSALLKLLGDSGLGLDRKKANLEFPENLISRLEEIYASNSLTAVINAAAYTAVDLAEQNEATAFKINGEAPRLLASWCKTNNIPFVHYSTDYVFPGTGNTPWKEEDQTSPLSVYGRSKLEGEKGITATGGRYLIFRTSWVYDATGKNFFNTMLRLGKDRQTLQVVADQYGAPTYAPHLAQATLDGLKNALQMSEFPSGIYHLCQSGEATWHEFAVEIFDRARKLGVPLAVENVQAIPTSAYPTPARRPLNSRLNSEKAKKVLGVQLPNWKMGLEECFKEKSHT